MASASAALELKTEGFKFIEKKGDLFSCPASASLAHCVSEDLRMGKGIAVLFKQKFSGIDELKKQGKGVGEVAILHRQGRFIYYLITKKKATGKPTYDTLRASLMEMKKHCVDNYVTDLAIPYLGCGLDRLDWTEVSTMICELFCDTNLKITAYQFDQTGIKEKSEGSRRQEQNCVGPSSKNTEGPQKKDVKMATSGTGHQSTMEEYMRRNTKPS